VEALFLRNLIDLGSCVGTAWLAAATLHIVGRASSHFISRRLGWNAVLVTGWLGVPLHELSHLLVARLFGHRIVAWKLFEPDPSTGTLGYVWHAYRRRNLWSLSGNFFIGMAPLAAGGLALFLLVRWLGPDGWTLSLTDLHLPPARVSTTGWPEPAQWTALPGRLASAMLAVGSAVARAKTLWLPLQLYLCVAVASHTAPSPRDLASAGWAMPIVVCGVAGLALASTVAGWTLAVLPIVLPIAALLVAMVALFQGFYVVAIAVAGATSTHARRAMGRVAS
jgi:hypothetical protein